MSVENIYVDGVVVGKILITEFNINVCICDNIFQEDPIGLEEQAMFPLRFNLLAPDYFKSRNPLR